MPLTPFQSGVLRLISVNRTPESHLAGAAAIHAAPTSQRYSGDVDLFHDSVEAVAEAYHRDSQILLSHDHTVSTKLSQPGFIRALVGREGESESVLIDWATDSAWRFMPPVSIDGLGYVLHPVDLAVNKVLALAGREEPRDWVDILFLDRSLISLGALVFAAVGKDPGLNPTMLLELLARKGRMHPRDLERIRFAQAPHLPALSQQWDNALQSARNFVHSRPAKEAGHLYIHTPSGKFFTPGADDPYALHAPTVGGILPRIGEGTSEPLEESDGQKQVLAQFFGK